MDTPTTSTTSAQQAVPATSQQLPNFAAMSPDQLKQGAVKYMQMRLQNKVPVGQATTEMKNMGITLNPDGSASYQDPTKAPQGPDNRSLLEKTIDTGEGIGESVVNTTKQGANDVTNDVGNNNSFLTHEAIQNGTNPAVAKTLGTLGTAGNVVGDVAKTAGGYIGDVLSPFIPDAVKSKIGDASTYIDQKVSEIPGMTPEIQKGLGNVFNTLTLEGGAKAEGELPDVANAADKGTSAVSDVLNKGQQAAEDAIPDPDLYEKAKQANKVINPDGIITSDDFDKLTDIDKAGNRLSEETGTGKFAKTQLKPEALIADPHNELVRDLIDKGSINPKAKSIANIAGVNRELQNEGNNLSTFFKDPKNDVNVTYNDLTKNVTDAYNKFKNDNSLRSSSSEAQKARAVVQKYLDEIKKVNTSPETSTVTKASMVKKAIENFNGRMKNELGDSIYDGTPEGKAQVKMAKLIRKSGYDTIQNSLNELGDTGTSGNAFKNSVQQQAKLYDLIDEMKSRVNPKAASSDFSQLLNSNKGYAIRRLASRAGPGAAGAAALAEILFK